MYVDYEYYSNTYGGRVKEDDFVKLEIQARSLVDYYTFNRIKEVTDNVRLAVCELIDNIKDNEDIIKDDKGIASEKVGGYSVTYADRKSITSQIANEQKVVIAKYLGHTGMMYRGS